MRFKRYIPGLAILGILCLSGCSLLLIFDDEKRAIEKFRLEEEQYKPYKLQNTIEGYREFIEKYPNNQFVSSAKYEIESLEFAPYEQDDSIEGYMEFKIRYPENRNVSRAEVKIGQREYIRYEKMDSPAAYQEFLEKYPESTFAVLAKERLQELQLRELDGKLNKEYGFDLLLYRLRLKRLQKRTAAVGGFDLANFTPFALIAQHEGQKYFHTCLIYPTDLPSLKPLSAEEPDIFFDHLISKILVLLDGGFKAQNKIDGFSFDIASSAHLFYGDRKTVRTYYFPVKMVSEFTKQKIDKHMLLAKATILTAKETLPAAAQPLQAKKDLAKEQTTFKTSSLAAPAEEKASEPQIELDGPAIMKLVIRRDKGRDYIVSTSWEMVSKSGRSNTMKTIEKMKNLGENSKFVYKSLLRYLDPPDKYGTALLTWNYRNAEKAFWYRASPTGSSSRIPATYEIRSPAEADFYLGDYLGIQVKDETHRLLKREPCGAALCYVVESIPVNKQIQYGKRRSWIHRQHFIPLKIDYYDTKGDHWKTLAITWQQKYGIWFWQHAVVENVKTGTRTSITIEDVRVNVGLEDSDLSRFALERKTR